MLRASSSTQAKLRSNVAETRRNQGLPSSYGSNLFMNLGGGDGVRDEVASLLLAWCLLSRDGCCSGGSYGLKRSVDWYFKRSHEMLQQ